MYDCNFNENIRKNKICKIKSNARIINLLNKIVLNFLAASVFEFGLVLNFLNLSFLITGILPQNKKLINQKFSVIIYKTQLKIGE